MPNRCAAVRLLSCLLVIGSLAVAVSPVRAQKIWTRADAAHLLRRAAFGGTPQQIERLYALGRAGAVEYLITGKLPAGMPPEAAPFAHVDLPDFVPPTVQVAGDNLKKQRQLQNRATMMAYRAWWIDRMVRSDRPLTEKMTLFWSGLFTSGIREVKRAQFMVNQNLLFHKMALGNFEDLTRAMLRAPALLAYLNNNDNRRGHPNENLGRELMELFTMGQGQGYTETDVHQVGVALTGATFTRKGYLFRPRLHDPGLKTIFGHVGHFGPDDVVNLIFSKPEPAHHLARRLWTFFVYAHPSEADLAPVVRALQESHYDVPAALRALFTSEAFYSAKAKFTLVKSPADLVVGTLRLAELTANEQGLKVAGRAMAGMGQILFQPPNVKGWPGGKEWITASNLYTRYNAATGIIEGYLDRVPATSGPRKGRLVAQPADPARLFANLGTQPTAAAVVDAAIARFLQRPLPADKRQVLIQALGTRPLRLDTFDGARRVRMMIALLLSTPEYQLE